MSAKTLTMLVFVSLMTNSWASPSADTYSAVTNDWYNANFSNVYELAQIRLANNSNDVVGAYMMLEWDLAFGSISSIRTSITRTLELSDCVTNGLFRSVYVKLRESTIAYRDEFLPTISDADIERERFKSYLPHKLMVEDYMLRTLWKDGLW